MEAPGRGAVVLVRFPFSDLSGTKLRPAVVLADAGRGDRILCEVTSKPYGDATAVPLDDTAFASRSLRVTSCARPGKLFTASVDLIPFATDAPNQHSAGAMARVKAALRPRRRCAALTRAMRSR